ncbi:MAG TPA: HlyU family transcriptional regulator [Methylomirabilota bacterium]|nr:HlyU family transcriptional regulator [Methylomirabilota bacterium]
MSFLKKLFGGGGAKPAAPASTEEYKGYTITAHPVAQGGSHRVAGTISKTVDGATREKRFDRSDTISSHDEAVAMCFQKGRLIIDQSGDRLFD